MTTPYARYDVGDVIWVHNSKSQTFEAIVQDRKFEGDEVRYFVHYKNWDRSYDEWIDPKKILSEDRNSRPAKAKANSMMVEAFKELMPSKRRQSAPAEMDGAKDDVESPVKKTGKRPKEDVDKIDTTPKPKKQRLTLSPQNTASITKGTTTPVKPPKAAKFEKLPKKQSIDKDTHAPATAPSPKTPKAAKSPKHPNGVKSPALEPVSNGANSGHETKKEKSDKNYNKDDLKNRMQKAAAIARKTFQEAKAAAIAEANASRNTPKKTPKSKSKEGDSVVLPDEVAPALAPADVKEESSKKAAHAPAQAAKTKKTVKGGGSGDDSRRYFASVDSMRAKIAELLTKRGKRTPAEDDLFFKLRTELEKAVNDHVAANSAPSTFVAVTSADVDDNNPETEHNGELHEDDAVVEEKDEERREAIGNEVPVEDNAESPSNSEPDNRTATEATALEELVDEDADQPDSHDTPEIIERPGPPAVRRSDPTSNNDHVTVVPNSDAKKSSSPVDLKFKLRQFLGVEPDKIQTSSSRTDRFAVVTENSVSSVAANAGSPAPDNNVTPFIRPAAKRSAMETTSEMHEVEGDIEKEVTIVKTSSKKVKKSVQSDKTTPLHRKGRGNATTRRSKEGDRPHSLNPENQVNSDSMNSSPAHGKSESSDTEDEDALPTAPTSPQKTAEVTPAAEELLEVIAPSRSRTTKASPSILLSKKRKIATSTSRNQIVDVSEAEVVTDIVPRPIGGDPCPQYTPLQLQQFQQFQQQQMTSEYLYLMQLDHMRRLQVAQAAAALQFSQFPYSMPNMNGLPGAGVSYSFVVPSSAGGSSALTSSDSGLVGQLAAQMQMPAMPQSFNGFPMNLGMMMSGLPAMFGAQSPGLLAQMSISMANGEQN